MLEPIPDRADSAEATFQKLLEDLNDGVCIFRDEVRLFVNEEYVQQHGFESAEHALASRAIVGVNAKELLEWRSMAGRWDEMSPYRFQMAQLDGSWKTLEATYSRVTYGGTPAWASVTRDVSAVVEARRRLDEQILLFRRLFEDAPVGIMIVGKDGTVTEANSTVCKMLGLPLSALAGSRISERQPELGKSPVDDEFASLVAGAQDFFTKDREWTRPDGLRVWFETITSAVKDDRGSFLFALRVLNDVTKQRLAQSKMAEQIRVDAEADERQRLARDIHDTVVQDLTGVAMQLAVASKMLERDDDATSQQLEYLDSLVRTTLTGMRQVVWNLSGDLPIGLNFEDALESEVRRGFDPAELRWDFRQSGNVRLLPMRVQAVLLRIAREATSNIVGHANASGVSVTLNYEPGQVRLEITDNGVGLDPGGHEAGDHGGFGLLSMYERAKLVGGEIEFGSGEDGGFSLSVTIPV